MPDPREQQRAHLLRVHGSGPTVLLTNGYSATAEMWKPNIAALSQRYQLILWDMRGHGQTDSPAIQLCTQKKGPLRHGCVLMFMGRAGSDRRLITWRVTCRSLFIWRIPNVLRP